MSAAEVRRAAVLGSPIGHSRSPDLHLAAYRALGLTGWTYERIECTAEQLPDVVGGAGPDWVGFSVTMPGKFAALESASSCTERARLIGAANTLVRTDDGWHADNTDVDGVSGALRGAGIEPAERAAVIVGAGGTARPAIVALAAMGITSLTVVARDATRAHGALELAQRVGLPASVIGFGDAALSSVCASSGVLVSTVPAEAAAPYSDSLAAAPAILDVIYHPWPTELAAKAHDRGSAVVGGLEMLLNQAFTQVELFTGQPAPRAAMASALR
ncbi:MULTISPECIES: shikimate dehydrogenase [Mycobacteroides]|jgi:shikimate dehydrogenase|uniref:Shikimate dehydrogenase n=1 Tax=Mycobacteroides chelonae TaxID=1774 RepID=A0AB73U2P8_MYCCH|nr:MULTISPECIES: shikimate dehydrogenase [Mycobacteroides]MBF9326705.1 shikimate dehydrogenase [Mycobacteroides chelonae]MBF9349094.1 shikimate dehydrogenase [Mycobacteroides chelonae]MBF9420882.1 shikimate dehydrogenase [Mycobacteroides chelonae]MBF9436927.1 shikimate dehydrogenase [Mycobacteroides chelonae]MBV6360784.1 shikimate dehydrogenase [Mycobacteroides chelonae]